MWLPTLAALIITAVFQFIGPWTISLGFAKMTVYPMVWGLIAGALVSAQRLAPFTPRMWKVSDRLMATAVAMLVTLLGFTIGPNLPTLAKAGPALLLQEVGHLFGTIALALPIAVLLRMGRATVGATFAIDREASFAIVGGKYGTDSEEYRGVMSMYVFGTMFGAVVVALAASTVTSLNVFDPQALAMGVGVGSTSMMAAGLAAITSAHPEMADQVKALATTSNMITMILGTYVGVWIALPLADKVYRLLTRKRPDHAAKVAAEVAAAREAGAPIQAESTDVAVNVPLKVAMPIILVLGIVTATVAANRFDPQILLGYTLVAVVTMAAIGLGRAARDRIPMIIWASLIGTALSSPWSPVQQIVVRAGASISFLSLCCVVLTFGGLAMAQNLPALRRIGWRIVPVGTVAIIASFLLATVIAEFALGLWH
ncbi:DUF3100 domain-containing protein [Tsukamurella sputi]|uniref:DUF3100 domain-containing protein n=1 Tax=Tsukamurella sputi TaxID=2591848 RepID=A0A5C5RUY0_9ACTN|nr:DUF3100 domain-containing protein [Tsukamurella sputi]